jgi:Dam-replacing family
MNLRLPTDGLENYRSASQRVRICSESWAARELYCPRCTSNSLDTLPGNTPVLDFRCPDCQSGFQLKSAASAFRTRLTDGAYAQMHAAILQGRTPNLFLLHYTPNPLTVTTLTFIPDFAFPFTTKLSFFWRLSMPKNHSGRELCYFTYADGRRCTLPQFPDDMGLCYHHREKRQAYLQSREAGRQVSLCLDTDILTACDLSRTLSALFAATAQGYMKPKLASSLAYLAQLMLQTHKLATEEYLETFERDWQDVVYEAPAFTHAELEPQPPAAPLAPDPTSNPTPAETAVSDSSPGSDSNEPAPIAEREAISPSESSTSTDEPALISTSETLPLPSARELKRELHA